MVHTFNNLDDIIEDDEVADNSLIQFYEDFRKYLMIQPISLVFISHDDYEKIDHDEITLYEERLGKKFYNLMAHRFVEQ